METISWSTLEKAHPLPALGANLHYPLCSPVMLGAAIHPPYSGSFTISCCPVVFLPLTIWVWDISQTSDLLFPKQNPSLSFPHVQLLQLSRIMSLSSRCWQFLPVQYHLRCILSTQSLDEDPGRDRVANPPGLTWSLQDETSRNTSKPNWQSQEETRSSNGRGSAQQYWGGQHCSLFMALQPVFCLGCSFHSPANLN